MAMRSTPASQGEQSSLFKLPREHPQELDEVIELLEYEIDPAPALDATREARARDAERLAREAEAQAKNFPTRAALMHCFQARVALDLEADPARAEAALQRAAALTRDARFVAVTRRWLVGREKPPAEVLTIARAELPFVGDPGERAALLWEIVAVALFAGRPDAERSLREIVVVDPGDLGAWLALATLAAQRKDWRAAAEAWETAANTDDKTMRASLLAASAGAREAFLSDPGLAASSYERALEADAGNAAAQSGLESIYLRTQAWADYARLLVHEAAQVGDAEAALAYHERAGDVLWECLGDGVSATDCYVRATALSPTPVIPLGKLAALYEQLGRYPELSQVYRQLLDAITDPLRKAAVLLRLGSILQNRLDQPEAAQKCYEQALELAPTLAPAAQALAGLLAEQKRTAPLCALLLAEADRLAQPIQRAARYVAIAELREAALGIDDDVVELHERALALDPGQAAALDALDRIYRSKERWDSLIALHEAQLASVKDPRRARALRLVLAALCHERGHAPERAAVHLRAALAAAQDDLPTLIALARALFDAGKWTDYVDTLEAQARLYKDPDELVATLFRIATVVETRIGDPTRALAAYQKVLERAPRHEPVLQAVLRLERELGRWENVVAVERKLLELVTRPEEAAAIHDRLGQLIEERLARPDDAMREYEESLARLPANRMARVALERLLRQRGQYARLALLLERQAQAAAEPVDKARLYAQAAALLELHPERADAARASGPASARSSSSPRPDPRRPITLYEQALELVPGTAPALWGLCRVREQASDWPALRQVLESLSQQATQPKARARLLVRLARLHELRLVQPERALELYQQAVSASGEGAAALDGARIALTQQDEDLPRRLGEVAALTSDPKLALGLSRLHAIVLEHRGQHDAAAGAYVGGLEHQAGEPQMLDGLARSLARAGSDAKLPPVLAARARLFSDASSRALGLAVAGMMWECAGQAAAAETAYGEAIAAVPELLPAIAGKRRLRAAAGDLAAVAELSARMGAVAVDPELKAELYDEAGDLCQDRLDDVAAAFAHYRAALAARPGRTRTLERALALLEAAGEWGEAVALVAGQVEAAEGDARRAELLARSARLRAERLGDLPAAIIDAERAVKLRPGAPELLELLAFLHESAAHWADASLAYEQLARALTDVGARRAALVAHARIWIECLPDYPRARAVLEELVRLDPEDRGTLARLAQVALLAGDGKRALELHETLTQSGPPVERARSWLTLAEAYAQLGDSGRSEASLATAFDLAVQDAQIVPWLERHLTSGEGARAYVGRAEAALARAPRDAAGVLALRASLATVLREQLGSADEAVGHLRAVVESRPDAAPARVELAGALLASDLAGAVVELRRAIDLDATSADAFAGLALAWERKGAGGAAAIAASAASALDGRPLLAQAEIVLRTSPLPAAAVIPLEEGLSWFVGASDAPAVRAVFSLLEPHLHEIYRDATDLLKGVPVLDGAQPAATLAHRIARSLSVPAVALHRGNGRDPFLVMSEPRALVIGPDHLSGEPGLARLRFDAAYALSHVAGASTAAHLLEARELETLLRVVTDPSSEAAGDRELRKRVSSALPRRVRKELERVVEQGGPFNARALTRWVDEERRRAWRTGVVFCRDLRVAAQALAPDALWAPSPEERRVQIRRSPALLDALRFAASDSCLALAQRVHGHA
jgi:tetratricopeptide (TPR) repeat protein